MASKKERTYNLETMAGIGKKIKLAGREYEVLPVNIADMHYVFGEEENKARLHIFDKKSVEDGEIPYSYFATNLEGKSKSVFLEMVNKYVYYLGKPMTEDLLIEHNWSFKEIAHFLWFWIQEVSE